MYFFSLSDPVFLYVFSNLLSSFIYSICQRNNRHKSLELAGPPSPFDICLLLVKFAAGHVEGFLNPPVCLPLTALRSPSCSVVFFGVHLLHKEC